MRKFIATSFVAMLSSTTFAADGAKFRAIGFSDDGSFFAFEQYGVQDGSGFAYADVFVLDIKKDEWVKGTPASVLLEDESGNIKATRAKALLQAKAAIAAANINTDVETLAANPMTEVVPNRNVINFHNHYNFSMGIKGNPGDQGSWDLSISKVTATPKSDCFGDQEVMGYKLELKNRKTGKIDVLHEDKDIPASRFCPIEYDLEAIVQPADGTEKGQLVAIIGVSRRGFEGLDRRFIALPFAFN
jgi:predicted secreted protein